MIEPDVFPDLNSHVLKNSILDIIQGYPVEKVLLYQARHDHPIRIRDTSPPPTGPRPQYILVFVLPTEASTPEHDWFSFGFDRKVALDEAFVRAARGGKGLTWTYVDITSDSCTALGNNVIQGQEYWVLYDAGADQGEKEASVKSTHKKISEFDKGLLAFERKVLKKNPCLSVPDVVKLALKQDEEWLYTSRCGARTKPKQETIEKHLRHLRKKQKA